MNPRAGSASPGPFGAEYRLIEELAAHLPGKDALPGSLGRDLVAGIGDDAAVWSMPDGRLGLLSVDTMVEGIHTLADEDPVTFGARALTAAVSDIVAMGGTPMLALTALQVPADRGRDRLTALYDGIAKEAARLGCAVVGGDVVDTSGPLALAISVYGTCEDPAWLRSGARAGDLVAATGTVGGSGAGLRLLELARTGTIPAEPWCSELIDRHLRPHARSDLVPPLRESGCVRAAIDISDGISSEAWHLALASDVRIVISADAVPVHPALEAFLSWRPEEDEEMYPPGGTGFALGSGEEYELLLILAHDRGRPLLEGTDGSPRLRIIGGVEAGPAGVELEHAGRTRAIGPSGHQHHAGGD